MCHRLVLLVAVFAVGCGSRPPAPIPVPVPPATPVASPPEAVREPVPETEPPVVEAPPAPPVETYPPASLARLLLCTPRGPLIVEFVLTIDSRPFRDVWEEGLDQTLRLADIDGDGRVTWAEALANPRLRANAELQNESNREQAAKLYDLNRNGLVDRNEIARLITGNGRPNQPFYVVSTNQYRGDNRSDSPVLRLLDADEDGELSADEITAATVRLRTRDADDDGVLLPAELREPADPNQPQASRSQRPSEPDTAVTLEADALWELISVSFEELYPSPVTGRIAADSFPLTPELFGQLDANGNGVLSEQELKRLTTLPPHVRALVTVDSGVRLEVRSSVVPADGLRRLGADRVAAVWSHLKLFFFARDDAAGQDARTQADALLAAQDADKNGYLDEKEFMPAEMFASYDVDGDGQVTRDELIGYMSAGQSLTRAQFRVYASDLEDALFAGLDTDSDGRLSTRELESAAQRLRELDENGDGRLTLSELPATIGIGVVRGDQSTLNRNQPLVLPAASVADRAAAPNWFQRMDANGDGEISRQEFVGNAELFERLDKNRDGFLDAQEAADQ